MRITTEKALSLDELGMLSPDDYCDAVEYAMPEIFKQLYPRRILNPQTHYSGRFYAAVTAPLVRDVIARTVPGNQVRRQFTDTDVIIAIQALICINHKSPLYFISRSLAEALLNSKVPSNTTGFDLPRNRNTGIIILPKNYLVSPDGRPISCLSYSFVTNEEKSWLAGKYRMQFTNSDNLIMTTSVVEGDRFTYGLSIELNKSIQDVNDNTEYMTGNGHNGLLLPDQDDNAFNAKCFNLLCNILFLMDSRPEILKESTLERKGKEKKGKKTDDLWTPQYIGFDYKSPSEKPPSGDGTHASPRMHWRQGHWRNQPFGGKDAPQIKRIWIDTILVSATI